MRKNGFNDADNFFASHIDESNWPYSSLMFDPRPWTVILEKSARLIGSKPKGRLVPREGGDALGAYINNELLSYQWDDNSRLNESMIQKYGASFGLTKWKYCRRGKAVFYDGPDFIPCNPRDVLANPSYSNINKWFQYREWVTLKELEYENDIAHVAPIYKNLDKLREALREDAKQKGDRRSTSYQSQVKKLKGLEDYLGQDEVFPVVELVTEYRPDRWITFSPRHGVVVRDIPNPYNHGEIPVVSLRYYPLPDDLYGVSEFEPVAKQIRAINAHVSAYSDKMALKLRPPIHVNPTNVRMHSIEWNPEAKWLMNNPNADVQVMKMDYGDDGAFQSIYSVLTSSLLNAWGETSQGTSNVDPFEGEKTATEVRDSAFTRNVRDNMNQIFLSEALKKQTMFWHSMNQQYMFKGTSDQAKIVRIVGRDAVEFFNRMGLADMRPTEEESNQMATGQLNVSDVVPGPRYPVGIGTDETGMPIEAPKFMPDEAGMGGNLIIEPGDLVGNYDYMPDIETMQAPSQMDVERKLTAILGTVTNPAILQLLAQEGKKPKVLDLLVKMFESTKVIKDAEAYFEELPQQPMLPQDVNQQPNTGGAASPQGGAAAGGTGQNPGMAAPNPMVNGQLNQQMV
jgi:hypothetical protein